jgi:hypothetical protein
VVAAYSSYSTSIAMAAGRGFTGRYDGGGGVRWSCGDARALFDPRLNKKRSRR